MFKKLLERKSKLSLAIDLTIVLLAIFIMIPQTRKGTIALVLKPTLFAYQPTLLNKPVPLFNASARSCSFTRPPLAALTIRTPLLHL